MKGRPRISLMVLVSLAAAAATMTAVYAQASRTPERSFSSRIIPPGADLEVTVRMSGHVNAGTLVETIPAGFGMWLIAFCRPTPR